MNTLEARLNANSDSSDAGFDEWKRMLQLQLFEYAPDAMLLIDESTNVIMANCRAASLFEQEDLAGQQRRIESLFPNWSMLSVTDKGTPAQIVTAKALRGVDQRDFLADVSVNSLIYDDHRYFIFCVRDAKARQNEKYVTETTYRDLERYSEHLESLVRTDALTGLLNRRGLESVLVRETEYARRNKTELIAALIDLDNFKKVNDEHGHYAGDLVLTHVADVIRNSTRAVDWVGRIGGDEFLLLLPATSSAGAAQVAERIRLELSRSPLSIGPVEIRQTASLGVAAMPKTLCSIEEVLQITTLILKNSKRRGKNCVSFGDGDNTAATGNEISAQVLDGNFGGFHSLVQPIVRLDNLEVTGYELLTRGPVGPLEMPEDFIRISSENNMLTVVDLRCLEVAAERIENLPKDRIVHQNLFPSTIIDVPVNTLIERLTQAGSDRKYCIELSERRIVSEPGYLKASVEELKSRGILIALDNVGCGHSSLEALLLLEPNMVKIDRRLIHEIRKNPENQRQVAGLIKIAQTIGALTIGEGIEKTEDLETLLGLGLKLGQGFLLGKPQ